MECKSCKRVLSTELGARPVLICAHLLCETCFVERSSCSVCEVVSASALDDVLCHDMLKTLKELEDLNHEKRQVVPKFKCKDHYVGEFSFFCSLCHQLSCSTCATECIRAHNLNVSGYTKSDLKSDIKQFSAFIDNTRNTCTELSDSLCKLDFSAGETDDIVSLFDRCFKLAGENRHSMENLRFRPLYPLNHSLRTISGISVIFKDVTDNVLRMLGGKRICLLYRASRDGASRENFLDRCAHCGPTLVAMKVGKDILGAVVHHPWSKTGPQLCTKDDIIFLLDDGLRVLRRNAYSGDLAPEDEIVDRLGGSTATLSVGNHDIRVSRIRVSEYHSSSVMFPWYITDFCFGEDDDDRLPFEKFKKQFSVEELECFAIL